MRFIFIAVNYNGFKYTKEYIKSINSIFNLDGDEIKIIIVDNASQINEKDKLENYCKRIKNVKLIKSFENLGYFKGLNKGIDNSEKNKEDILIVGNNDLTFDKNFIKNFKEINYNKKVFVIAPNIITKDGKMQNPQVLLNEKFTYLNKIKEEVYWWNFYVAQVLRLINKTRKIILFKKKESQINNYGEIPIKRGIGACYILTPNFFDNYNKLDDRVFMWGEEVLITNQVKKKDGIILYTPNIKIIHHESASVKIIQSKKRFYMVKDSYKIYKKYL